MVAPLATSGPYSRGHGRDSIMNDTGQMTEDLGHLTGTKSIARVGSLQVMNE